MAHKKKEPAKSYRPSLTSLADTRMVRLRRDKAMREGNQAEVDNLNLYLVMADKNFNPCNWKGFKKYAI